MGLTPVYSAGLLLSVFITSVILHSSLSLYTGCGLYNESIPFSDQQKWKDIHINATEDGFFTSVGYPDKYENDEVLDYTITAPRGSRICLNFTDFKVEPFSTGISDMVVVYPVSDGNTGPYCGGTAPPEWISSATNFLAVVLFTNNADRYPGFNASYRLVSRYESCVGKQTNVSATDVTTTEKPTTQMLYRFCVPLIFPCTNPCELIGCAEGACVLVGCRCSGC